jgi:hypothetical protein
MQGCSIRLFNPILSLQFVATVYPHVATLFLIAELSQPYIPVLHSVSGGAKKTISSSSSWMS